MPKPVIDKKKCTNCGTCVDVCPVQVFSKEQDGVIVKKASECIGCRACESQCPEGAIKILDE